MTELASGDGIAVNTAFRQTHHGEEHYYITNLSVIDLAEALSLTLTETGRAVLAGQLDSVATCGIDRWLGGVHLQSAGKLWRWDARRQRVTA